VSLDAEVGKVVKQLSELEATRDGLDIEFKSLSRTLVSYKEELTRLEPGVAKAMAQSNDAYIRRLQEELAQREVQRSVIIAQNPDVKGDKRLFRQDQRTLIRKIAELKKNLQERIQSFIKVLLPEMSLIWQGRGHGGFLPQAKQRSLNPDRARWTHCKEGCSRGVIAEYERQFQPDPAEEHRTCTMERARLSSEKLYLLVEEKFNEAAIAETSEFGYGAL